MTNNEMRKRKFLGLAPSGLTALYKGVALAALVVTGTGTAQAVPLLNGFQGPAGYGELAMTGNDDGSSNEIDLPFAVNFFGNTYSSFWINNNGNVTFSGSESQFTPEPFPIASHPMIAPFWGDVDTRCNECGEVYVASPNAESVVVTWNNVGYYSQQSNKLNNFQLVLRDRSADFSEGDFDIEFRYDRLEWTTGGASGGTNGLGGTPAQAGFDAGDNVNYFTLPGSQTAAVLNLTDNSNVAFASPGFWSFAIRQGGLPGETPSNPLMPVVNDASWEFDFHVDLSQQVFIDPEVAIGYDYVVNSGPNFQSVLLPTGIGDNLYDLWFWDGADYLISGGQLTGGVEYDFGTGGVDRFRILGVELGAMLDPTDTSAFVTGLTFAGAGQVNMFQTPLTFNTDPTDPTGVPEPSSILLLIMGMFGVAWASSRNSGGQQAVN
jgi:hypothetical protein